MNNKLNTEHMDDLFEAILCLKDKEECSKFFDDLCTVIELQSMSQRMQVAKMLNAKKVYKDIVAETGASTATISRVNRTLNYQGKGGYALVFKRINGGEGSKEEK